MIIAAALFEAAVCALGMAAGAAAADAANQTLSPLVGGAVVAWAILPAEPGNETDHVPCN